MDTLPNKRLQAIQLLQLANRYADGVIFWNNSQRQVLKHFLKLIRMLLRSDAAAKKMLRRGCSSRKDTLSSMKGSLAFLLKKPIVFSRLEYFKYLKMPGECFHRILDLTQNSIRVRDPKNATVVPPEEQLGMTVRYLATGETHAVLSQQNHISRSFVSTCLPKVCKAIWNNMKNVYLKFPDSVSQWEEIASEFEEKYQFPRCVGALKIKRLDVNGIRSMFLIALADTNCKLLYTQIVYEEDIKDAVEGLSSKLCNILGHTQPERSASQTCRLPYVMVTNSVLSQHNYLLKPYAADTTDLGKCVYNERLERACQAADTLFAVLLTRFEKLRKKIFLQDISRVELVAGVCCVLHNFLLQHYPQYTNIQGALLPAECDDESICDSFNMQRILQTENDFHLIREEFVKYFSSENIMTNCGAYNLL